MGIAIGHLFGWHFKIVQAFLQLLDSGAVKMDVNGVEAGIELFLGDDVLRNGRRFIPVQWTAFDVGSRRYQGEVLRSGGSFLPGDGCLVDRTVTWIGTVEAGWGAARKAGVSQSRPSSANSVRMSRRIDRFTAPDFSRLDRQRAG